MSFQCPGKKRLNIFHKYLVDRYILLHCSNSRCKSFILFQDRVSLWVLHPLQNLSECSTRFWHIMNPG